MRVYPNNCRCIHCCHCDSPSVCVHAARFESPKYNSASQLLPHLFPLTLKANSIPIYHLSLLSASFNFTEMHSSRRISYSLSQTPSTQFYSQQQTSILYFLTDTHTNEVGLVHLHPLHVGWNRLLPLFKSCFSKRDTGSCSLTN